MRSVEEIRALIERGLEENPSYTTESVMEGLSAGLFQCFEDPHGIVITRIQVGLRSKRLHVFLLVGENFDQWKRGMNERLKNFAKASGCSSLGANCRPGLKKALRSLGWKVEQIILTTGIE